MGNGMYACSETKGYDKRRQKQQRPKRCNLAEMVMPGMREKEWPQSDRQKNQRERRTPKQTERRAVKISGVRHSGKQDEG